MEDDQRRIVSQLTELVEALAEIFEAFPDGDKRSEGLDHIAMTRGHLLHLESQITTKH